MNKRCCLAGLFAWALAAVWGRAASPSPAEMEFFEKKVRPFFSKHCYECHSAAAGKAKGGLTLDSREGWTEGGDSGEAIEPGQPDKSLVMELIRHPDPKRQMPPKYRLSEEETAVIEEWIRMGAPDPRQGGGIGKNAAAAPEKGTNHWAFKPVRPAPAPRVKEESWVRDDLDRFILARQEAAGIGHGQDADRFTLIRRVTFDLTGLPPSPSEVSAFLQDPRNDDEALAAVVDRLLQSERYGERWARHWLDVVRYADSVGRTRNAPFPYAWKYRNYVIDSFNQDKPYDRFLTEQIAGDLLPAESPDQRDECLIATGFLALGSMDLNERDDQQFLLDRVDDQVDTLGRAFLGMTLGCARCHDHKFDPIAQADYYALAGIFSSTRTLSGQKNKGGGGTYFEPALLATLTAASPSKPAGQDAGPERETSSVEELRSRVSNLMQQVKQKQGKGAALRAQLAEARKELFALQQGKPGVNPNKKKKQGDREEPRVDFNAPLAMAASEGKAADLALRVRGEPDLHGPVVARGFPAVLSGSEIPAIPANTSGRMQLALWLTSPSHPLASRVMVNRIWGHLFGRGIVPTVDNFGVAGEAPTHPELLDHLAARFVENGWSVKSLVRSLVLSRTYRLSSDHHSEFSAKDESNRLYWRMNLRRLEAEAIRDSFLAAAGVLEVTPPRGPVFDRQEVAALFKNGGGKRSADSSAMLSNPVRTVYLPVFRSRLPGMFTVFDFAEPDQVNGQRDVTTVAPQALFMLNNDFVIESARLAARRILELPGMNGEGSRVDYAYAYTLCRRPSPTERSNALAYLESGAGASEERWASFLQALFSTAEFRYLR